MRASHFIEQVLDHRRKIIISAWGEEHADLIKQLHCALLKMIRDSAALKKIVEGHTYKPFKSTIGMPCPPSPPLAICARSVVA